MWTLFRKEIKEFFSSITGYLVVVVYLAINSLIMWIFPGNSNVLNSGFANLDPLFVISPWVFLFLVPAVTMRLISEEKKTHTMELLLVRPISEFKITLAKYFAGLSLVVVALLPTFLYTISINELGAVKGIADMGAIVGAYLGLLFLAGIYTAIGLFASSLSNNQVISFILAVLMCFVLFIGFEQISIASLNGGITDFVRSLGVNYHYRSIARGVIDSRDIVYFLSVIFVFLMLTKLRLESRKWK